MDKQYEQLHTCMTNYEIYNQNLKRKTRKEITKYKEIKENKGEKEEKIEQEKMKKQKNVKIIRTKK